MRICRESDAKKDSILRKYTKFLTEHSNYKDFKDSSDVTGETEPFDPFDPDV